MSRVHFEERRDGRTDIMLGVVTVGVIVAVDHPELRAAWMLVLPPWAQRWSFELDTEAAKDTARRRVAEWIEIAGLT